MNRLHGKIALITGAAAGIGAETARQFVREGARVLAVDLDGDAAAALAAELGASQCAAFAADVSVAAETEAAVGRAAEHFGGLDVLVNSAGISPRSLAPDASYDAVWTRVMDVNAKGTALMCRAALPAMRARGAGSIVNLASVMSFVGYRASLGLSDGFSAYPQSKGAVVQLTRDLASNAASAGIRVNAVCPGFIFTNLTRGLTDDEGRRSALERLHPMGRLGQPAEVASVVLFLASDEASFVTGAAWTVDGGYTAV